MCILKPPIRLQLTTTDSLTRPGIPHPEDEKPYSERQDGIEKSEHPVEKRGCNSPSECCSGRDVCTHIHTCLATNKVGSVVHPDRVILTLKMLIPSRKLSPKR